MNISQAPLKAGPSLPSWVSMKAVVNAPDTDQHPRFAARSDTWLFEITGANGFQHNRLAHGNLKHRINNTVDNPYPAAQQHHNSCDTLPNGAANVKNIYMSYNGRNSFGVLQMGRVAGIQTNSQTNVHGYGNPPDPSTRPDYAGPFHTQHVNVVRVLRNCLPAISANPRYLTKTNANIVVWKVPMTSPLYTKMSEVTADMKTIPPTSPLNVHTMLDIRHAILGHGERLNDYHEIMPGGEAFAHSIPKVSYFIGCYILITIFKI